MSKFTFAVLTSLAVMVGGVVLIACTNDDDTYDMATVDSTFVQALATQYPGVSRVEWEMIPPYIVAGGVYQGHDIEVWYDSNAQWAMIQTDYDNNTAILPTPVKQAIAGSEFATWRVDDIDLYERPTDAFYKIEVESPQGVDRDLFITIDGTLAHIGNGAEVILPSFRL